MSQLQYTIEFKTPEIKVLEDFQVEKELVGGEKMARGETK